MSRFHQFGFSDQYVNLDHVRSVTPNRNGVVVTYTNGDTQSFETRVEPSFEQETAPIIPAAPGFELLIVGFDENRELTADEVLSIFCRYPVIAWRMISKTWIEPVALDAWEPSDGRSAVLRPDGVVVELESQTFENIEAWAEDVCASWKKWHAEEITKKAVKAVAVS